uniref:Uncharacterized protein n=1 Tax=Ixodes ricinus TaxID=34613 RepID=A0A6B0UJT0_IXORI
MQLLVAAAPLRPCFYCAVVFPPASPAVQKLPSAGSLGIRVNKLRAIGRRRESRQRAKNKKQIDNLRFLYCSSSYSRVPFLLEPYRKRVPGRPARVLAAIGRATLQIATCFR